MILQDIHEPMLIQQIIAESGIPVTRENLNGNGYADYKWNDLQGNVIQWERKKAAEVIGGHSRERATNQLLNQLILGGRTGLIVEGLWAPSKRGVGILSYLHPNWRVLTKKVDLSTPYTTLLGWFASLIAQGIPIMITVDETHSAYFISSIYRKTFRDSSTLFEHTYIPEIRKKNTSVATLLGVTKANPQLRIGEDKAEAIIKEFGSIYNICQHTAAEIATVQGIGKSTAEKLLEVLGAR